MNNMSAYTFFDVETPNRNNDRICSIGVERVDKNGTVEYSEHFFVDPEQGFDRVNVDVHHITPSQIKGKPTFAELWEKELSAVMQGSVLVAHNASFDMGVLNKTFDCYEIEKPQLNYIDTLIESRRHLTLPDYKLPTVADYFGVVLTHHHDAMADTHACEGVYWGLVEQFGIGLDSSIPYIWVPYDPCARKDVSCDQVMTDLYGIALGLSADMVIRPEEIAGLQEWLERNKRLRQTAFICDAFNLIEDVLSDGVVTKSEHSSILSIARPFVQNGHNKAETVAMQALIGFLRGISCDSKINLREARALQAWMDEVCVVENSDFKAVRSTVERVLDDGVLDVHEEQELLSLFDKIVNPAACQETPSGAIVFEGSKFVLTGDFSRGSKADVASFIEERGGAVAKSISKKVAYVVVGGEGSAAYAYGNYGTKVKKAMELQDDGFPIQIIQEDQLEM